MTGLVCGVILTAGVAAAANAAMLWKDPGPVASLDLAGGPGGRGNAPQSPFVFQQEEMRGTAPKVVVRDARGAVWMIKFGPEVKAETFATRFVWAAGYPTEPTYYVREGNIEGASGLGRAAQYIDRNNRGSFRDARFQLRDNAAYRVLPGSTWALDEKSVAGTKELAGLKLVVMLVSNWDMKPENMSVIETAGQKYYAITDWGASMGRAGDLSYRSKWECAQYAAQSEHFVEGVADGYVSFNHSGKQSGLLSRNIRVEDVKWFMERLSKLTDAQIRAGLEASGAAADEAACFTRALRRRLEQLAAVASASGTPEDTVIRSRTVKKTRTLTQPRQ